MHMKKFQIFVLKLFTSKKRCIFLISFIFFIYICYIKFEYVEDKSIKLKSVSIKESCINFMPVVRLYGMQEDKTILHNVKEVFSKTGYRTRFESFMEWDVLWSYTYPFYSLAKEMVNLKHNQKVNHFPGSGFITQKSNLAGLPDVTYIPKSFMLPDEKDTFLDYTIKNKHTTWILKSSNHRGMKLIKSTKDINVNGSFIQEFVERPLLINGKKFDVGVYVMLTSIDPLRVYVYGEEVLLRFCKKDYFPLNSDLPESYIVGDDYLPIWEVPDLKLYFSELNFTAKESLNEYLRSKAKSTKKVWTQINKAIQDVYLKTEDYLKQNTMTFGTLRNFFELVRFDFILDEDLNVFLLEVNMSPNLSSAHFIENKLMYTQIIFNSLSINGLVRKFHDSLTYRGEMEVSDKDIQVFAEQCASQICQSSCKSFKCQICNPCLNQELKNIAKSAYLEFINRGKFRRLLPRPTVNDEDNVQIVPTTAMNAFMDLWFKGKCLQDSVWCQ